MSNYEAGLGLAWVCGACGKASKDRSQGRQVPGCPRPSLWDESCFMYATLVVTRSIRFGRDGRVRKAKAVKKFRRIRSRPW